jgi:predicted DNA-binding transcriptional regulator YafY
MSRGSFILFVQSAVFADRRVLLRYRSAGQSRAAESVVDPYGLVCKSGVWYLVADAMFARMFAAHLTGTPSRSTPAGGEWAEVSLRFAAVPAARPLLSFGGDVAVLSPPEVRDDLLAVASAVTACYSAAPATR